MARGWTVPRYSRLVGHVPNMSSSRKKKNTWLSASEGENGLRDLPWAAGSKLFSARGVNITVQWADCKIAPCGKTKETHIESTSTKTALNTRRPLGFLGTAKKVLLNLNTNSEEAAVQSTSNVFRHGILRCKTEYTDFERFLGMQAANGVDIGRLLHGKTLWGGNNWSSPLTCGKKNLCRRCLTTNQKWLCLLMSPPSCFKKKSTLIIFLRVLMASWSSLLSPWTS